MSTCNAVDCQKPVKHRGLCGSHYALMRRAENPKLRESIRSPYKALVWQARKRGLECTLTAMQHYKLTCKPCAYGGGSAAEYRIGIDRRDNSIGYTVENSQPCCARHNQIKSDVFTHGEMVDATERYASLKECGNTRGGRPRLPVPEATEPARFA